MRNKLASLLAVVLVWMGTVSVSQSQTPAPAQAEEESPIQDNGFLVEEAYNQEDGVVQHASLLNYFRDSKDWNYGFTQEWPLPFDWRHQFSYTLSAVRPGALPDDGPGFGDVALNYRYQLVGSGKDRVAVAPRFQAGKGIRWHGLSGESASQHPAQQMDCLSLECWRNAGARRQEPGGRPGPNYRI